MAKYQMHGVSNAQLRSWLADFPDFSGSQFGGPGPVSDVTLYSAPALHGIRASMAALVTGPSAAFTGSIGSSHGVHAQLAALISSPFAAFSGSVSSYSFATDPQVNFIYDPSTGGLANQVAGTPFVTLTAPNGAVPTGTDADGNAVWQYRSATNLYHRTPVQTHGWARQNPTHLFIIAKAVGTPAVNGRLFSGVEGLTSIFYVDSTHVGLLTGSKKVACVPGSNQLYNVYAHNQATVASVQNSAYAAPSAAMAGASQFGLINGGFCLGANLGVSFGDWDVAYVLGLEGQASAQFLASFTAFVRARWPSLGLPNTPPTPVNVAQTSLGALAGKGNFDVIWATGQSQSKAFAQTATVTPSANVYMLGNDNIVQAMPAQYDAAPSYLDGVNNQDSLTGRLGGFASKLCNDYSAATGRPVLFVSCGSGGANMGPFIDGDTLNTNTNSWDPAYPKGNKVRNSLFGSAVARVLNAFALPGATGRFGVHFQGEAEAENVGVGTPAGHAARTTIFLNAFYAAIGLPIRCYLQQITDPNGTPYASPANVLTVQNGQAGLAVAHSILIGPKRPSTDLGADNTHLTGAAYDAIGAAAAAAALAEPAGTGWY